VATAVVVRMRLWRLDDRHGGRNTALRVGGLGALIVACCVAFGMPPAYEAGRLVGCAAAVVFLWFTGEFSRDHGSGGVRRVALAAALFALAWWATGAALVGLEMSRSLAGELVAGGVPAFLLLPGPIWLERLWRAFERGRRLAMKTAPSSS
jgi:hypothetical protein